MSTVQIWHGSQRWDGNPAVQRHKKGHCEHGPGIYCTTNLSTASKYSKGGGRIVKLHLHGEIKFLEDVRLPFVDVIDFVKNSRLSKRRILVDDLVSAYERRDALRFSGEIPATFLVNLAVNNECASGQGGPELAAFLAANSIHASLYRKSAVDDWLVIFDPSIIEGYEVLYSKDIDWTSDQLVGIPEQIAALKRADEMDKEASGMALKFR